ncbi:MAG: hypothetical protein LBH98_06425 [Chitinispirillales bacterium]|jgi:hypothetical protein|nr:hypothetical protein [Chitinispirillales bacterium]
MKIKFCVISSVEDEKFLKFIDGLQFLPKEWETHVLRNKPLSEKTKKRCAKNKNLFMRYRENSQYVSPEIQYGIKFVKLRYDSVQEAHPEENDWIMLGDDDMFFDAKFRDVSAPNIEEIAKSGVVDFLVGTYSSSVSYSFTAAKREGIRHGQVFRYRKEIMEEYYKYYDTYGGGEDSMFALINYMKGRCVTNITPGVEHTGHNLANYIPKPYDQNNEKYVACIVTNTWLNPETVRVRNKIHTDAYCECKSSGLIYSPNVCQFNPKAFASQDKTDYIIRRGDVKHSGRQQLSECGFEGNVYENNCKHYIQLNEYVHPCKWLGYSRVCVYENANNQGG